LGNLPIIEVSKPNENPACSWKNDNKWDDIVALIITHFLLSISVHRAVNGDGKRTKQLLRRERKEELIKFEMRH
jgi:hypothetical protein